MNFSRSRAQVLCETIFSCSDFEQFFNVHHGVIEGHTLDNQTAFALRNSLALDAKDLYFKGCQSLTESLTSYNKKLYSWAIVKAYYSIFYMIKADFALKDYALIRHKCIYYLHASTGCALITKGRNSSNRVQYSGDHKSAINYYKDLFSNTDILLSQEIEGMNAYHWIMKKRERINYQERDFKEPDKPDFLEYIHEKIVSDKFLELIEEIRVDTGYILTFQPEFAPIAIPLKRALLTKRSFLEQGISDILTPEQTEHLKQFNPFVFI